MLISQSGHVHGEFGIRFLFSCYWFNNLVTVNRIYFFSLRIHRLFYRWELKVIKIKTYIEYFIIRAHGIIRAAVIAVYVHLQFGELFCVGLFFLIHFGLLLFDVVIILVPYDHLSCHSLTTTFARSDLDI